MITPLIWADRLCIRGTQDPSNSLLTPQAAGRNTVSIRANRRREHPRIRFLQPRVLAKI